MFATLLSGCIFTKEPAFDATNSVESKDSSEFNNFLETTIGHNYKPFVGLGGRGKNQLRVFHIFGDRLFIQETFPNDPNVKVAPDSPRSVYYTVSVDNKGNLRICMANVEKRNEITRAAEQFDVAVKIENNDKGPGPDAIVSGSNEKVRAFIIDRLQNGPLKCDSAKPPTNSAASQDQNKVEQSQNKNK